MIDLKKVFLALALSLLLLSSLAAANSHREYSFEKSEQLKHLIDWKEYGQAAFDQAKAGNKPVMMVISAVWCYWCHVYESTDYLYSESIYPQVNERFVPVFVDSDRRPDLTRQYLEGGWPSTTFLTPEKERISGFSGPRQVPQLLQIFSQAEGYNKNRPASGKHKPERQFVSKPVRVPTEAELKALRNNYLQTALSLADSEYGGFGSGQKFPQALTEDYFLSEYDSSLDVRFLDAVKKTADNEFTQNLSSYRLFDPIEGGFHRYGTTRRWTPPHYEKMLPDNARQIRMLSHLQRASPNDNYSLMLNATLEYVFSNLRNPSGGFAGSQDAGEKYYLASLDERKKLEKPFVDRTVYSDWNAEMASALLYAAQSSDNATFQREALSALSFVLEKNLGSKRGVLHNYDPASGKSFLDGQLADQADVLVAVLDAYQADASPKWLQAAKQTADYSLGNLFDWVEAGFFERHSNEAGLYARDELLSEQKPAEGNGAMAYGLLRLYNLTKEVRFLSAGLRTLAVLPQASLDSGYYAAKAADYALNANLLVDYEKRKGEANAVESKGEGEFFLLKAAQGTQAQENGGGNSIASSTALPKPDFSATGNSLPQAPFIVLVLIAFAAGLLSFLSPCLFSIMPVYFAHALQSRSRIVTNTLGFFLGLAAVLSVLGVAAVFVGQYAAFQQKQVFGQAAGLLVVALGAATILGKGFSAAGFTPKPGRKFGGSVAFGALFTIGWSPCIGPVLVSIFAIASQASTALQGALLLVAYSAGIAAPLLAFSIMVQKHGGKFVQEKTAWLQQSVSFNALGRRFEVSLVNLASGVLMIAVGALMASGYLYAFNSWVPEWLQKIEGRILGLVG